LPNDILFDAKNNKSPKKGLLCLFLRLNALEKCMD